MTPITVMDPQLLAAAQELSKFAFEIPQNPDKIRSCYAPNAQILTHNT